MRFRLGYGWLLVGGQVWLPGAIWGWWPGECLFFFLTFPKFGSKLLRAIPYFISARVMLTNYIGRYDQSSWGKREHLRNEWICNCLATARFSLTRTNGNVCGGAILAWGGGYKFFFFSKCSTEMCRPFVKLYIIFESLALSIELSFL